VRRGRNLVLTEPGHVVARYADQIFALGEELAATIKGRSAGPRLLVVGVSDVLARSIVHRILEPALRPEHNLHVICKESRSAEAFHAELAGHTMDVVLSDAPASPGGTIRMFSHALGECGTTWFAAATHARRYRRGFPRSLDGAPLLLPSVDSTFRRALDEWFAQQSIRPSVVAELDDVALVNVLGEQGLGLFAAPELIEAEVRHRYRVQVVGRTSRIRQRFFAISIDREIAHPGVAAICERARKDLFARR
jgi:LysR family transcriptional regulator, transcriptional activator of nhaA